MIKMTISQRGIPQIIANLGRIQKGDMPLLKRAIGMAANHIADVWRSVVAQSQEIEYNGQTFTVSRRTGNYERSVRVVYPYENDLSALIKAEAKYAGAIESGTPPHDMKPGLLKGRKFVRIPFRHGTPTGGNKPGAVTPTGMRVMSEDIYNLVKAAGTIRTSSLGQRSKVFNLNKTGKRITYTWKTGLYTGMRRVGAKAHGQYMTFRTVSINSDPSSWWHPGLPPRPISRAVAEMTKDQVGEILQEAMIRDLS